MTKMALFHWAKFMESRVFDKWRNYTIWIIQANMRADNKFRRTLFDKYFTFWLNEFIRKQNEKQWRVWRESNNKSLEIQTFEKNNKEKDVNVKVVRNDNKKTKGNEIKNTLFFPYCGRYGDDISEELNVLQISGDIIDCELKTILIPKYDCTMTYTYK